MALRRVTDGGDQMLLGLLVLNGGARPAFVVRRRRSEELQRELRRRERFGALVDGLGIARELGAEEIALEDGGGGGGDGVRRALDAGRGGIGRDGLQGRAADLGDQIGRDEAAADEQRCVHGQDQPGSHRRSRSPRLVHRI